VTEVIKRWYEPRSAVASRRHARVAHVPFPIVRPISPPCEGGVRGGGTKSFATPNEFARHARVAPAPCGAACSARVSRPRRSARPKVSVPCRPARPRIFRAHLGFVFIAIRARRADSEGRRPSVRHLCGVRRPAHNESRRHARVAHVPFPIVRPISPPCEGGVRGGGTKSFATPNEFARHAPVAPEPFPSVRPISPPNPPFARGGKIGGWQ
jgi:hypothetical protein